MRRRRSVDGRSRQGGGGVSLLCNKGGGVSGFVRWLVLLNSRVFLNN